MAKIFTYIFLLVFLPLYNLSSQGSKDNYSLSSKLSSGTWFKMAVTKEGIYRISYSKIAELGLEVPSNPRIFSNNNGQLPYINGEVENDDLEEIAIFIDKGTDNVFNHGDYLMFFGQTPGRWEFVDSLGVYNYIPHNYSDTAYYFITSGGSLAKKIKEEDYLITHNPIVSWESDALYYRDIEEENLIKSGRRWFERLDPNNHLEIDPGFSYLVEEEPIKIDINVTSRSSAPTQFRFMEGSTLQKSIHVGAVNLSDYNGKYAELVDSTGYFIPKSNDPNFELQFYNNGTINAKGWVDFIKLQGRKYNVFNGETVFLIDSKSVSPGRITRFYAGISNHPEIWDVTDPVNPKIIPYTTYGNNIYFDVRTDTLRRFVMFDDSRALSPIFRQEVVPNQDLHGSSGVDMVIVAHPLFKSWADSLADLHKEFDGITSLVTTPEEIYNEFSGGITDIVAIRNFVRMKYLKQMGTDKPLKYLLLFGDGSYENRTPPPDNPNFIPTYQSENSNVVVSSFTSDDFYTLLEDGEGEAFGTEDIGVGRLPVTDTAEARIIVGKIAAYMDPGNQGDWKNVVCLVADDEDNNTHVNDAEKLSSTILGEGTGLDLRKIYIDSYQQVTSSNGDSYPEATAAINNQINSGCLIFNYIGHGSENGLAEERITKSTDIEGWSNGTKLPLFITATCEFSRFDDAEQNAITGTWFEKQSAGEKVLFNGNGGAIALMSTTRIVYSSLNHNLNNNIYEHAFDTDNEGNPPRMGDIIRLAKNDTGNDNNKRNFSLLGDPALRLNIPYQGRIITDSINGISVTQPNDTLKALSVITIKGHLENYGGTTLAGYNGTIIPVVYDKDSQGKTLANDGGATATYNVTDNIIFKGKSAVENGQFEFSFVVPREIDYNFGEGRIRYYVYGEGGDMSGAFNNLVVGGFSNHSVLDTLGPNIKLYLNDTLFRDGGITGSNPLLLAKISDPSGINTSGYSIGHDIIGVMDDNNDNYFVLNSYFENDFGSYTDGTIYFPLTELSPGIHSFSVKAWDNYNNSTTSRFSFVVEDDGLFLLENLMNYPNPMGESTHFTVEHNRPGTEMEVVIRIYGVNGQIIRIIKTKCPANGYQLPDIGWDGTNGNGDRVGRGLYPYSIEIKTGTGERAFASGRIIIL